MPEKPENNNGPNERQPSDDASSSESIFSPESEMPIEHEDLEVEEPEHQRRAASAEFVVSGEAGSASILREAMDPANQSLGEALRLSYRVLQIVIIVLIGLFLVSGFKRVQSSQTGVKTLFGEISGGALEPGLAISWLPYPAAEFIVFEQSDGVQLLDPFWPNAMIDDDPTYEDAAQNARPSEGFQIGLGPTNDGMVLIEDGIGHIQLQASYLIEDPTEFVRHVKGPEQAREIVRTSLERAVIHVTAAMTLEQLIDQADGVAERVQFAAQEVLDDLNAGIQLSRVQTTNVRPPLAVYNSTTLLGQARSTSEVAMSDARIERRNILVQAAGQTYEELLELIKQYERVLVEEGVESPVAQSLLQQIDLMLTSDRIGGTVSEDIARAKAYKAGIVSVLGSYADRFESLYPSYSANPDFVVRSQLIETYQKLMDNKLVERIVVPVGMQQLSLSLTSDEQRMLDVRRESQEQRRQEAQQAVGLTGQWRHRLGDYDVRRRLDLNEQGDVVGRNQNQ